MFGTPAPSNFFPKIEKTFEPRSVTFPLIDAARSDDLDVDLGDTDLELALDSGLELALDPGLESIAGLRRSEFSSVVLDRSRLLVVRMGDGRAASGPPGVGGSASGLRVLMVGRVRSAGRLVLLSG